jgi:hypothetical protein
MLRYLRLYRTIIRTFGFRLRPLRTFLMLQLHRALNASTRGLDHLLCPRFRRLPLERPIFILGNPRSGTTFMHRFLLGSGELAAFELWEMLLPAITARRIFGGLVERLAPLSPARYHGSEAHETGLRDVETDDAMAFFHFVNGGFLWSYFLAWEDRWGSALSRSCLDLSSDPREMTRYFRYMEACWRRNLASKDRQRVLVKSSLLTGQAPELLRRYPDAKLLYLVRDPVETIPSGMALLTGVLERSYDMFRSTTPEARALYLENLYQAACHLYRSFHDLCQSGALPEDRYLVVPYPAMMRDLEGTIRRVVDFAELEPGQEFWDGVRTQAEKQRSWKSRHTYSLEKFNLTAERIRADLAFVREAYDV